MIIKKIKKQKYRFNKSNIFELILILIFILMSCVAFLFLIIKRYPLLRYNRVFAIIMMCLLAIMSFYGIVYNLKKTRTNIKPFHSFSSQKKILQSILYLLFSITFLFSIEYLCYLGNKKQFNISRIFHNYEISKAIENIKNEIKYNQFYEIKYTELVSMFAKSKKYSFIEEEEDFFLVAMLDTIELRPYTRHNRSSVPFVKRRSSRPYRKIENEIYRGIKISFSDEYYDILHPHNENILKSIQNKDSISSSDLYELACEKKSFYFKKTEEATEYLNEKKQTGLGFISFISYNISKNGNIANDNMNLVIRFILFLQVIIITLSSGYIYKHIYKILDGETSLKEEEEKLYDK